MARLVKRDGPCGADFSSAEETRFGFPGFGERSGVPTPVDPCRPSRARRPFFPAAGVDPPRPLRGSRPENSECPPRRPVLSRPGPARPERPAPQTTEFPRAAVAAAARGSSRVLASGREGREGREGRVHRRGAGASRGRQADTRGADHEGGGGASGRVHAGVGRLDRRTKDFNSIPPLRG